MAKKKKWNKKRLKAALETQRKTEHRNDLIEAGAYDGRFAPKSFKDKKKEADKKSCRKFKPDVD